VGSDRVKGSERDSCAVNEALDKRGRVPTGSTGVLEDKHSTQQLQGARAQGPSGSHVERHAEDDRPSSKRLQQSLQPAWLRCARKGQGDETQRAGKGQQARCPAGGGAVPGQV